MGNSSWSKMVMACENWRKWIRLVCFISSNLDSQRNLSGIVGQVVTSIMTRKSCSIKYRYVSTFTTFYRNFNWIQWKIWQIRVKKLQLHYQCIINFFLHHTCNNVIVYLYFTLKSKQSELESSSYRLNISLVNTSPLPWYSLLNTCKNSFLFIRPLDFGEAFLNLLNHFIIEAWSKFVFSEHQLRSSSWRYLPVASWSFNDLAIFW